MDVEGGFVGVGGGNVCGGGGFVGVRGEYVCVG